LAGLLNDDRLTDPALFCGYRVDEIEIVQVLPPGGNIGKARR